MLNPLRSLFQASAVAAILLAAPVGGAVAPANAFVAISVAIAPPALPIYVQPAIPGPGYLWTPGYWAWDGADYYWVPGTWALPPRVGLLWTPGYWGWNNGLYVFNAGYWGPTVGFYGGIPYGFGYTGIGFAGGYWQGGAFFYNRSVNNFGGTHITNVYNKTVIIRGNNNRVSFNGGTGGVVARPTPAELAAAKAEHVPPTADQLKHEQIASKDPATHFAANKGAPPVAATARPGELKGEGATPASEPGAKTEAPKGEATPKLEKAPKTEAMPKVEHKAPPREPRVEHRAPRPAFNRAPPRMMAPHAAAPRRVPPPRACRGPLCR